MSNKVKEKKKEPIEFPSYDIKGFYKAEELRKETISIIFQKKYPSYLKNKDITLDIKGDIVSIKRLDLKKLSPQFSFGGCKTKECALIKNALLTKSIDKRYIESPRSKQYI